MSVFSPSGVAAPAATNADLLVTAPTIVNQTLLLADTEYSIVIPEGAKRFQIRTRQDCILRVAYVSGGTASLYRTVGYGNQYEEGGLSLSGGLTVYLRPNKGSVDIELTYWS